MRKEMKVQLFLSSAHYSDLLPETELRELEALYAQEDCDRDTVAAAQGRQKETYLSAKSFVKVGRDLRRRQ